jgi:hypothetical protein
MAQTRHLIPASLRQHPRRSTACLTTLHEPWFTVRLPVPLIARVRARAAATGQTLSVVVAQALENSY